MAAAAQSGEHKTLHIAMFPWLAFGHIIPFLELAKLIAQKGHKISFISTPRNIDRLPKLAHNNNNNNNNNNLINLVKIPFTTTLNLPENAEATIDLPFDQGDTYLKKAYDGLNKPLTSFLETHKPHWIIYDFAPYWLPQIAATLGISRCFFNILSARSTCFFSPSTEAMLNSFDPRTDLHDYTVAPPWVPFRTPVCFRLHEAKTFRSNAFRVDSVNVSDLARVGSVISGSDVIATRSSMELESDWVNLLRDLHRKPVVPVGLIPPSVEDSDFDAGEWFSIEKWLNEKKKQSVVYIAFGSEAMPSQDELTELAHGLELSELPEFSAMQVGVEIPRKEDDGTISRTSLADTLKMVMLEENGKILMENAGKMKKVVGDKQVNNKYIDDFVTYLQNHV
ncbi:hypothetical protein ACFE04_016656 [Oxalis oulophora]